MNKKYVVTFNGETFQQNMSIYLLGVFSTEKEAKAAIRTLPKILQVESKITEVNESQIASVEGNDLNGYTNSFCLGRKRG